MRPAAGEIRAIRRCGSSAAATSASAHHRFQARQDGIPADRRHDRIRSGTVGRIALLSYADGEKRYIVQPDGLKVGAKIVSGPEADILVGNALPLRNIPPGTTIHNIELSPGKGAQMVRSAGGSAQLIAKEGDYATGEVAFGRDPQSCAGLSSDDRAGGQYWITRTSPSARQDGRAGWASVRITAAFR